MGQTADGAQVQLSADEIVAEVTRVWRAHTDISSLEPVALAPRRMIFDRLAQLPAPCAGAASPAS